jgi:hypothetical protein
MQGGWAYLPTADGSLRPKYQPAKKKKSLLIELRIVALLTNRGEQHRLVLSVLIHVCSQF